MELVSPIPVRKAIILLSAAILEKNKKSSDIRRISPLGDSGLRLEFGISSSEWLTGQIRRFCEILAREPIRGVVEWVPAYTTVAVYYKPQHISRTELAATLRRRARQSGPVRLPPPTVVDIPVAYGSEFGPDLADVAEFHHMSAEALIERHSRPLYLVALIGFVPGFPYLMGLPPELATPRLDAPRGRVSAGSVGIGGAQTGVYPLETPGGWRILGRTPLRLYDMEREPAALLKAGDSVRFVPITADEYDALAASEGEHDAS